MRALELTDVRPGDRLVLAGEVPEGKHAGDPVRVTWRAVDVTNDGIEVDTNETVDETALLTYDGEAYEPDGTLISPSVELLYRMHDDGERTSITAYQGELDVLDEAKRTLENELGERNLSLHVALTILADRYLADE